MTDAAAVLLTIVLTLAPGMRPEPAMEAAREALTKLGCTKISVGVGPGPLPRMHEVRGRCVKLGEGEEGK